MIIGIDPRSPSPLEESHRCRYATIPSTMKAELLPAEIHCILEGTLAHNSLKIMLEAVCASRIARIPNLQRPLKDDTGIKLEFCNIISFPAPLSIAIPGVLLLCANVPITEVRKYVVRGIKSCCISEVRNHTSECGVKNVCLVSRVILTGGDAYMRDGLRALISAAISAKTVSGKLRGNPPLHVLLASLY